MAKPLSRDFFNRSTLDVAQDLLGKVMEFKGAKGIITETEAYIGQDDPACHAARGKTHRNAIMFGPPGWTYVYFIYGMYHCLNFVTEEEGMPAAALIRGLKLQDESGLYLDGPGKLCRHLGITREHSGLDICKKDTISILDSPHKPSYQTTPRIGIRQGQDKQWRYVVKNPEVYN